MTRQLLAERIKSGVFILDGAMGTEIMASGISSDKCSEYLNVNSPEVIIEIHSAYFDAGCAAVITNSFGANKISLARHGLGEQSEAINIAAAENARRAAGDERYVLGGFGPTGDFLEPLGTLKPKTLKDAFTIQAKALSAGGVDGFIVETISAIDEAVIAVEAVKSVCDGLPVFVSFAYDAAGQDFRTMMGVDVRTVVEKIIPFGVDAIGFNCGTLSMDGYLSLTQKYADALSGTDAVLIAEPNAGWPELVDGKAVYKLSAESYADYAEKIVCAGAKIIGGCCGTTPAHIKAIAEKLL